MLDTALVTAVAALGLTTLALLAAGRHPWRSRAMRLVPPLIVVASLAVMGAAPEAWVVVATGAPLGAVMPRRWYAIGAWFMGTLLVAFGLYAAYLARATLLLGAEPPSLALGLVLVLLELGAMALLAASAFEMVDALCAERLTPALPTPPERWPLVCLQVPTYNEPPELVIETIRSLVALDYPALAVQVIDNNTTDPELWRPVEAECSRLVEAGHRVSFVHLPEWPGYKAGALNWGLAHLDADVGLIGIVDADYIVDPAWLRSTVPHFTDTAVAFVQTPQDYRAWESSASPTSSRSAWSVARGVTRSSSRAPWASYGVRCSTRSVAGTSGSSPRTPRPACASWRRAIAPCTSPRRSGAASCP
jgi:hypothetical protein